MAPGQEDSARAAKLEEIRGRLMGNPSREELESMQLNLDVMEKYDRIAMALMETHHHDHMDDHDHSA